MSERANHGIRKCDSHCHNANHDKCVCWCGGLFHGKNGAGNRAKIMEIVKERFPNAIRDDDGYYYMTDGAKQMELF